MTKRAYTKRPSAVREAPSKPTLQRRALKIEACLDALRPQIARTLAFAPESEWIFGRLFLVGLLNQSQYDVALRLDTTLRRYRHLLAPHGRVKGWRPESLRGGGGEDLSPEAQKKMMEARREYEKMYGVLKRCGRDVVSNLFNMLESDELGDLQAVYIGLNRIILGE
jgi:hypothetical protein